MRSLGIRVALSFLFACLALLPAATTIRGDPVASNADAAYPLNHTFDADVQFVGSPPSNYEFEASAYSVGTPPANHDLQSAPQDVGTPPTNHDFETGNFNGWTTSGTYSMQSDSTRGYWAKLQSSGTIITSAFTVDSSTQSFAFDVGYLTTNNYSWVKVYALTGTDYATQTLLKDVYCNSCGYWARYAINASGYLGQSIKLKFYRYGGDVGIDDVSPQIVFPNYTQTGTPQRNTETDGDVYAFMEGQPTLTSPAFTVDSAAQFATVAVKGIDSQNRSQYKIHLLSGAGYGTSTQVALGYANYGWQNVSFNVSSWQGQSIKLKAEEVAYKLGVDDFGLQSVNIPNWAVTGNTTVQTGGPTGNYVRTDGQLTSPAFALHPDAQHLTLDYRGDSPSAQFYVELLRGADFSEVVDLGGGVVGADTSQWKTLKVGVATYAGETVKLRLRRWFGWVLFDNAGRQELAVPGWKLTTNDAVTTGSDVNGSYVSPFKATGTFYLKSVDVAPGIIDRVNIVDQKYYAVSYDIGYSTGNLVRVKWYNHSGQSWVVHQDAADTPTGFRTKYFWLSDAQGTKGYFEVQLNGGGKLYSIADNTAREHLREPFSQKVGYRVDSSTGSFGYQDPDIALEGRMPLSFTRYYSGHADRVGTLGHRWSHTYDTRLEFAGDDAGVIFGSGGQEFFIWSATYATFSPADARVHDELVKNGDGTYTLRTKDNLSYNFSSAGRLTSIKDLDNNTISLAYDASNRLITVTDPDSRSLSLTYDGNGRLATLTDPTRVAEGTAESGSQCGTNGTGNGADDDGDTKVDDGCPSLKYNYDSNGDLASVVDGTNATRTYTYNKHRLATAVDARGKTVFSNTFDNVNRVIKQTDPLNFTINISYDTPAKGVTSATDPLNNTAKYYFDTYHRTTDKVDPLGRTVSYVYDAVGNLDKIVDPNLDQWDFGYNSDADVTQITDPLGNPISISYNAQHLPTTITDARGYVTIMTYDSKGNLLTVADPTRAASGSPETGTQCGTNGTGNGADDDGDTKIDDGCPSTKYTYDSAGKVTSMTNAVGHVESYSYTNGNMTSKTDARGKVWSYTYDAAGRRITETTPLGHTTTYTYDLFGRPLAVKNHLNEQTIYLHGPAGHLLMVEDPLGNETTWTYDDRGLAASKTDPAGKVTTYTYDGNRNMLTETDPTRQPNGTAESGSQCGTAGTGNNIDDDGDTKVDDGCPTRKYTYDSNNRLLTVTDGEGGVTTYTYDAAGRVSSEKDPLNRTTSYTYNNAGRVLTITLPNTGVITYTYDANGNLLTETDPLNRTTSYAYDPMNRRTSMTNPLNKVWTYKYDAVGQLIESVDPLLNTTKYTYDATGNLASIIDPLLHTRSFGYDDAGRRTSMTDALSRVTSYGYDPANRLISVTAPGNLTTLYAYDAAGRMVSTTRPLGGVTTSTYDPRGLLLTSTDPLRQPNGAAESGSQCGTNGTGNNADDDGDTKIDDGCPSTKYTYDDAGRRVSTIDALGRVTTYAYDDAGRMVSMTDALGGTVSFGYDAAGQRTSLTNPRGKTTTYAYNSLGDLLTTTDPLTRTHTNTYNLAGELTKTTDARNVVVDYAYNAAGALTSETFATGSVTYSYDDAGRQTTMVDATGTTTWNYDAASRVTSVWSPQGNVSYTYNDADQRGSMTLPGSRTVTYGYDASARLSTVTDWQSRTTTLGYDSDSNRTTISRPNGVNSTYTYDLAGRLTAITHANGGGTLQSFTYTLDAAGNRTAVTTGAGTESYVLDPLNRITAATYTNGDVIEYTYDATGNRLTKKVNGGVVNTYAYDDADQLSSDGVVTYSWDANGNMTVAGNDSFTWDYANRMTGATVGGTATTYAYAGDGVRASKTVGGNTTSYVWDRESGLPVAVDDGTNRYMHADGLIAEIDGANAARYHLGDALGSVRGMADGAGALVATASYDVYGAVRATTGTESVFGYTGEQRDAETGFTYLRARYLNPALGRFMSADSVQPNAPGTQGYNLYAYVANNPATWVDPSGHSVAGAAMLGMVMADPGLMYALMAACLVAAGAAAGATAGAGAGAAASGAGTVAWQATPWVGLAAAVCIVAISTTIGIPAIICALDPACVGQATEWAESFAQTTATAIIEIVRQLKCRLVPPVLFIPLHVLNKMATKHAPGATMRDWIANPTGNFDTKNSEFNTSNKFLLAGYVEAAAMAGVGKWHESGASCRLHQMMLWEVGTTNWEDGWMPTRCLRVVLAPYSMYAVNSSYPVPESYCR